MRALARSCAACCLLLLAACTTLGIQRETELSASLPAALGLGAFASSCVFLCFVTARFTYGGVVTEAPAAAADLTLQRSGVIRLER